MTLHISEASPHLVEADTVVIGITKESGGALPVPGTKDVDEALGGTLAQTLATLAEVVRIACEVADPSAEDDRVSDLLRRFEDRDEPVTTVQDVEEQLAEAHGIIDPDRDSETLRDAVAVATYLAFRRDELSADPDDLIRRATSAEDVS